MKDSKITNVIISLLISSVLILMVGCQSEPIISEEEIAGIKADLGYVIAPTWLQEGSELFETFEYQDMYQERKAQLTYSNSDIVILMTYPADTPRALGGSNWLFDILNLEWQEPEDAVSMVEVNGKEAYFIRGSWSAEVLTALSRLEEDKLRNMTPDWDYNSRKTVYFDFKLSNEQVANVSISAMHNAEKISQEEIIKIAESCVQVE